jgi:hypothetical protein
MHLVQIKFHSRSNNHQRQNFLFEVFRFILLDSSKTSKAVQVDQQLHPGSVTVESTTALSAATVTAVKSAFVLERA